ncbi:MAG: serine/threonine-protein kinase, partial [Verrucomicrobiota bacterium]
YAHSRGIIHRDIKAANILVDPDDRVRIVDFGLVKMQENAAALTLRSTAMGTPLYMSPEQLRDSGSVDHRADIYAIGILFHQMLTGSPPQGAWVPASEKNPAVDKRYDAVVGLAMREDPDQRFQSTAELRDAVAAVLEPKSSKGKAILLGLAGIAALLIAAFFVTNLQDNSSPTQPSLANEDLPEQSSTSPSTSEDDPVIPRLPEPELTLQPHDHAPGKPFFVRYDSIEPAWFPDLEGAVPDDIIQFTIPPNAPLRAVVLLHSDGQISEIDFERPDTIAPVQGIDGPVHQIFENYGHFYWMHDGRVSSTSPGWEALADNDESFTNFAVGSVYCVGRTQSGTPRIFIRDLPSFDRTLREGVEDLLPNPMPELAKLDAGARKILALRPDGSLLYSATQGHALSTPPTDLGEVQDIAVASNLCVAVTKNGRARIWGTHRVSEEFKAEIAALRDVDKVVSASAGLGRVAVRYGPDKQWLVISQTGESNWRIERETGKALRGFDFVALGDEFAGGIQVRGVETEAPVEMAKLLPQHEHAPGEPFFVRYDSASPLWFPELDGEAPADIAHITIPTYEKHFAVSLIHSDGRASEIRPDSPDRIAAVNGINEPIHQSLDAYGTIYWLRNGRVTSQGIGWTSLAKNDERFTHFAAGNGYCIGRRTDGATRFFPQDGSFVEPERRAAADSLLPAVLPEIAKLDAGYYPILALRPNGTLLFSASPGEEWRAPPKDVGKVIDIAVTANLSVVVLEQGRARVWGATIDPEIVSEIESLPNVHKVVSASGGAARFAIQHGEDKQWLVVFKTSAAKWVIQRKTGEALRGVDFVALGTGFAGGIRADEEQ